MASIYEKMIEVLEPFAKEAIAWEGYDDEERIVEDFPEYYGDLRVKDLRNAKELFDNLRE